MDLAEEYSVVEIQRQRLSFLVRKSRRLEALLAELRSDDQSSVLENLNFSEEDEESVRELKVLNDSVNKLKAEYYCLTYQTNVYKGLIPPGLIDYMPDQPVETTLADPSSSFHDQGYLSSGSNHSRMALSNNGSSATTPTGDEPSTSRTTFAEPGAVPEPVKEAENWPCPQCSFINHPLIDVCEICENQRHSFNGSKELMNLSNESDRKVSISK